MDYSRIVRYLASRYSLMADTALGVYFAIEREGLGLPSARSIAEMCQISPSGFSRRMRGGEGLEGLVLRVMSARDATFPPMTIGSRPSWASWLPATDQDLADARVWAACEHLAFTSGPVAAGVSEVWARQRRALGRLLLDDRDDGDPDERDEGDPIVQALHALVMGLTIRRCVEREFGHGDALAVLEGCVAALISQEEAA